MGAAIGPTSILALFWKRATRAGVMAGMVTGTVVTIAWELTPALEPLLYELIPGFVLAFAATVGVSLATQPPADAQGLLADMGAIASPPRSPHSPARSHHRN